MARALIWILFLAYLAFGDDIPSSSQDMTDETKSKIDEEMKKLSPAANAIVNRLKEAIDKGKESNLTGAKLQETLKSEIEQIDAEMKKDPGVESEVHNFDSVVTKLLDADPKFAEKMKQIQENLEGSEDAARKRRAASADASEASAALAQLKDASPQIFDELKDAMSKMKAANPEAGKVADEAISIMKDSSLTKKQKLEKLNALHKSVTDPTVIAALENFKKQAQALIGSLRKSRL